LAPPAEAGSAIYFIHLLRIAAGRITEWRMVDAKPAESDRFWS
jgi:hypothetical protein